MRTLPIAVAALALLSTAASAQMTPPPRNAPGSPAPTATQPPAPKPAVNPLTQADVSKIDGTSVYGTDDKSIGHVSTVLMDPQSKRIDKLVVSAGGVIGIGSHRVAIPVDQFSWDSNKGAFKLQQTLADLKNQPEWVEGSDTTMTGSSAPAKTTPTPNSAGDGTTTK